MRGMVGRLCHGGERKPLEPYGWVAPFVRMVAWGALLLGSLGGLVSLGLLVGGAAERVYMVPGRVLALSLPVAVAIRLFAMFLRPDEVAPTAWDTEVRR